MFYTKEMIHTEFKEASKKDTKKSHKHKIAYLTALKEDMIKSPKYFRDVKMTTDQLQNLIDDWSAPKPIDAFYKRVFGMTYAEKKAKDRVSKMDKEKRDKIMKIANSL